MTSKPDIYESRMVAERNHYKDSLKETMDAIDNYITSQIREPEMDFLCALHAFINGKLHD
jgi:translation elongation factor EF-Tu-like GTPase